jgi:hypothetical protein
VNGILQPVSSKYRPITIQNMDDRFQTNVQWMQTQLEDIDCFQQSPGDKSQARQRSDSKSTGLRSSIACIVCRSKKQKVRTFLSSFFPLSTVCALAPFSVVFGLFLVRGSSFG